MNEYQYDRNEVAHTFDYELEYYDSDDDAIVVVEDFRKYPGTTRGGVFGIIGDMTDLEEYDAMD